MSFANYMKKLGYKSNEEGVCHGVAGMGMQAILAREVQKFNRRCTTILHTPADQMLKQIQAAREKQRQRPGKVPNPLLEIPAFFDGVELYQQSYRYAHLFPRQKSAEEEKRSPTPRCPYVQSIASTIPLVIAEKLAQEGIEQIDSFNGVYQLDFQQQQLTPHFAGLQRAIAEAQPPIDFPFALVLIGAKHAVTVGYDPLLKPNPWIYIDINTLPAQFVADPHALVQRVALAESFTENGLTMFETEVYASSAHREAVKKLISTWRQQPTSLAIADPSSKKGLSAEQQAEQYAALFNYAASAGDYAAVQRFLENPAVDPNHLGRDGCTPLHVAARNGHANIIRLLLKDKRVEPQKLTKGGLTALYWAAQNNHEETVKVLLEDGRALPEHKSEKRTPLAVAAMQGHVAVMTALLGNPTAPADPNTECHNGYRALHYAAIDGHEDAIRTLLSLPTTRINQPDCYGLTPLHVAVICGQANAVKVLRESKTIDLNAINKNGKTPLHCIVNDEQAALIPMLLEDSRIDANAVIPGGYTALSLAAFKGNKKLVEALLKYPKVDPDKASDEGVTPLMLAAANGHLAIVQQLLATRKIWPSRLDGRGVSALKFAIAHGHVDIEAELRKELYLFNPRGLTPEEQQEPASIFAEALSQRAVASLPATAEYAALLAALRELQQKTLLAYNEKRLSIETARRIAQQARRMVVCCAIGGDIEKTMPPFQALMNSLSSTLKKKLQPSMEAMSKLVRQGVAERIRVRLNHKMDVLNALMNAAKIDSAPPKTLAAYEQFLRTTKHFNEKLIRDVQCNKLSLEEALNMTSCTEKLIDAVTAKKTKAEINLTAQQFKKSTVFYAQAEPAVSLLVGALLGAVVGVMLAVATVGIGAPLVAALGTFVGCSLMGSGSGFWRSQTPLHEMLVASQAASVTPTPV